LPELVVTLAALRLGALDMALGNVMGSNLFNMAILAIDDVFYTPGALLSDVTVTHFASAFSAVLMSSLAIVGLRYRINHRVLNTVGWISLLLVSVCSLNVAILYNYGS
jgi:cation:H+ antiporter